MYPLKGNLWVFVGAISCFALAYVLLQLALNHQNQYFNMAISGMFASSILCIYAYVEKMSPVFAVSFFSILIAIGIISTYLMLNGSFGLGFFDGNFIQGLVITYVFKYGKSQL
jgi:hypothetical protein